MIRETRVRGTRRATAREGARENRWALRCRSGRADADADVAESVQKRTGASDRTGRRAGAGGSRARRTKRAPPSGVRPRRPPSRAAVVENREAPTGARRAVPSRGSRVGHRQSTGLCAWTSRNRQFGRRHDNGGFSRARTAMLFITRTVLSIRDAALTFGPRARKAFHASSIRFHRKRASSSTTVPNDAFERDPSSFAPS